MSLVIENASEVLAIWKDFALEGQERTARIHEIDAREVILQRDLLCAQVLFDGDGEVSAALYGGIVGNDHALTAMDSSDSSDDACAGSIIVVHPVCGQGAEL